MYSISSTKQRTSSTYSTTRRQTFSTKLELPAHREGHCVEEITGASAPVLLGIRGTRRYYRNSQMPPACRSGRKPTECTTDTHSITISAKNIWDSLNVSTANGCHVSPRWSGIWLGHVSLLSSKKARFIISTLTLKAKRKGATTQKFFSIC